MGDKPRIRVLHLVTRMNVGGVAVLLDNLMRHLESDEFDTVLVSGTCEVPEEEYLRSEKISYQHIKLKSFHKSINLQDDLRSFIQICRIIRDFNPDIIHTHTSKAGLYGRVAGLLVRPSAKRVHTFHGHLLIGYFNKFNLEVIKFVERGLGIISTGLVAMGTQVRNDLVAAKIAPGNKFRVFFPGLELLKLPSRKDARELLGLDSNKLYCTFIGRLTQIKRPDRVLDVAGITMTKNLDLEYLLVGDGDLSARLKIEAKENSLPVSFLGWRTDISTILAASDLLLLTSDNEAVALTLIEAAQAGIPIVTTPAGSVRDIAQNGENGFVTDFEPNSIATAVLELASDSQMRSAMGAAGAAIAARKFSVTHMVESHQQYYKELLSI